MNPHAIPFKATIMEIILMYLRNMDGRCMFFFHIHTPTIREGRYNIATRTMMGNMLPNSSPLSSPFVVVMFRNISTAMTERP